MTWSAPFVVQWDAPTNGPWVIARQEGVQDVELLRESGEWAAPIVPTGSLWRQWPTRAEAERGLAEFAREASS